MRIFGTLGFSWDRSAVPPGVPASVDRALFRYKRMLPQIVFDAGALEGNPFTFPQVQTLLNGVTVGGHKLSDEMQILNLASAAKELFNLVKCGDFTTDKATFDRLHAHVAKEEALEWGHFRGEGQETGFTPSVSLGHHEPFIPLATVAGAPELNQVFADGVRTLQDEIPGPMERGMAFFLFGALQQFYFDGNKRTSRFMMNGILMSHGMDAISVPVGRREEFNERMVRFFVEREATEMMRFLVDCRPDDAPRSASKPGKDDPAERIDAVGNRPDAADDWNPPEPSPFGDSTDPS